MAYSIPNLFFFCALFARHFSYTHLHPFPTHKLPFQRNIFVGLTSHLPGQRARQLLGRKVGPIFFVPLPPSLAHGSLLTALILPPSPQLSIRQFPPFHHILPRFICVVRGIWATKVRGMPSLSISKCSNSSTILFANRFQVRIDLNHF
jgi:hypothetical protein